MNSNIEKRACGIEGVDFLWWIIEDVGAFGSKKNGPLGDWIRDHKLFLKHVRNFSTVIQAGGNCGMYARFYANYFSKVYTFEPCEMNFACLNLNCVGDNFHKYLGALGNHTKKVSLKRFSKRNVGTHKIDETPGEIQMYRIDDLNLTSCDLIHLDIEGYEENALLGAQETIQKFRPVIITERSHGEILLNEMKYVRKYRLTMDTVFLPKEFSE